MQNYSGASNEYDARTFKVGEIIEASFHWSSRHPHFFVITRNSGKTIWAREIGKIVVSDDGYGQNGSVMPNPEVIIGKEIMGRINKRGYAHLDGNLAYRWDGRPSDYYTD